VTELSGDLPEILCPGSHLTHGDLFEVRYDPGVRDWETGVCDDWSFNLTKIGEKFALPKKED
jgi:hypothetical protein